MVCVRTAINRGLFGAVVLLSVLMFAPLTAQTSIDRKLKKQRTELNGTTPAQWRVIWTKHPSTRATISWSTAEKGSEHRVYYDTTPRDGELHEYANRWTAQDTGPYTDKKNAFYHHASITDLEPDTTYFFVMVSGESVSPELHFTTAPDEEGSFRLFTGGVSHSDPTMRRRMNLLLRRLNEKYPDVLALAHGGGYVKNGAKRKLFSTWLSDYELTTTPSGRVLPIIPARGKPEASGSLFQKVFHNPGWKKNLYSTRIGPDFLLITLNTTIDPNEKQRTFLEETLRNHPGVRWKVAQYYRPVYPATRNRSNHRDIWVPLFEQHGLDLALEYHGRVFKRTIPIRDGEFAPTGVVYMGEGGLGAPQNTSANDGQWYLKASGQTISDHHVTILNVSPDKLKTQTVNVNGRTIDGSIRRVH